MFSDSHKLLALCCSVSAFLLFKNLKIKQNKVINRIASSTFGILLIHSSSGTVCRFLWGDIFHNTEFYSSKWLVLHAIIAVFVTYFACLIIDQLVKLIIEKPIFCIIKHFTNRPKAIEKKIKDTSE